MSALNGFHLDPPDWNDNPPSQANIDDAVTEVFEDEDYLGEVLAESPAIAGYAAHLLKTSSAFRTAVLVHAKERIERRAQELADREAQDARDDEDDHRAALAHDEE